MKKIFFSLAAMASLVLASCTGDYTDWASPQAYSQDEAAAKLGITFVAGPEANIVMPTEEDEVRIVEIQSENNNVAGCTVKSITINGEEIEATTSGRYIIVNANDLNSIIQKTYRQPLPNRFLASLSPFCARHRDIPAVHSFLLDCFTQFFVRNIQGYHAASRAVHFVGSVAYYYQPELTEAARALGYTVGNVLQAPLEGLVKYHATTAS